VALSSLTRCKVNRLHAMICAVFLLIPPILPGSMAQASTDAHDRSRTKQNLDADLIRAVRRRDAKSVRVLLARGADPNARDRHARADRKGIVRPPQTTEPPSALLIAFDDSTHATGKWVGGELRTTMRPDPAAIVAALLAKGADPNVTDYDGTFPLLLAVQNRYAASARLLLEHGANANRTWLHGITPLHVAVGNRDAASARALMEHGADSSLRSAFDDPAHPLSEKARELLGAPDRTVTPNSSAH